MTKMHEFMNELVSDRYFDVTVVQFTKEKENNNNKCILCFWVNYLLGWPMRGVF